MLLSRIMWTQVSIEIEGHASDALRAPLLARPPAAKIVSPRLVVQVGDDNQRLVAAPTTPARTPHYDKLHCSRSELIMRHWILYMKGDPP